MASQTSVWPASVHKEIPSRLPDRKTIPTLAVEAVEAVAAVAEVAVAVAAVAVPAAAGAGAGAGAGGGGHSGRAGSGGARVGFWVVPRRHTQVKLALGTHPVRVAAAVVPGHVDPA